MLSGMTNPLPIEDATAVPLETARNASPGYARELWNYRDLLILWTLREVRIRYKQSFLGAAWAVLQPLVLMLVFTMVFSFLTRVPTGEVPYPLFCYTALLPWTFFAGAVSFAAPSLINNVNLVSKVYFPREILPIATVGAAFVDFLVATALFVALLFYYGTPMTMALLWVPVLLILQIALTSGVVLFIAALSVRFRDVRFLVPLGLQIWMFASPIIYPSTLVPTHLRPYYELNPMAGIISGYRAAVIHGAAPEAASLLAASIVSLGLLVLGYLYFKRAETVFADII
jgi:lipopolysaccharide transport system permease protein